MELLAPAGNLEKLYAALTYGADAVYMSGANFSLRAGGQNLSTDDLEKAFKHLHANNKKGYIATNIFAHNNDIDGLKDYLGVTSELGADAFIVADPGIVHMIKSMGLKTPIHLSTQANTTNYMSVKFWEDLGVERIVLARELSKEEIMQIKKETRVELEVFIHGSMCMAMSGRCLISNYVTGRDANGGECSQPCRWDYSLTTERAPEKSMPIEQDSRGSYFFNSKDLRLIEYLDELKAIGVDSLKIEGRKKSVMYVSTVVGVYRKALNSLNENPSGFKVEQHWLDLLDSVSNREFSDGFFHGDIKDEMMNYKTNSYVRNTEFVGVIDTDINGDKCLNSRQAINIGDKISYLTPNILEDSFIVTSIKDKNKESVNRTNPNSQYYINGIESLPIGSLLRIYNI